jgi:hypothetical protein
VALEPADPGRDRGEHDDGASLAGRAAIGLDLLVERRLEERRSIGDSGCVSSIGSDK